MRLEGGFEMKEKVEAEFTTSGFAAKAGITVRTLRYYDKIGLLKPSYYNSNGHRVYTNKDFAALQKIMTLKFIGFSLDEIDRIVKKEIENEDFQHSLEIQKKALLQKIKKANYVVKAIGQAEKNVRKNKEIDWKEFVNIIKAINMEEEWFEQYKDSSNLRTRMLIHEKYSTNKDKRWFKWCYEQMELNESIKILELGCGNGTLWVENIERIPQKAQIVLTDFSKGMLKDAKKNLKNYAQRFNFKIVDAHFIPFEDCSFDVVLANHMLYHVTDLDKVLCEIKRILKPGGYFYSSTVGEKHLKEMKEITSLFDGGTTSSNWEFIQKFTLDNGIDILARFFEDLSVARYEDNLFVTDAQPIIDYIFSMKNSSDIFSEKVLEKLFDFLNKAIEKNKGIFITKDSGVLKAKKT